MKSLLKTASLAALLPLAAVAKDKPNVIVFLVDDMGVMDTSVPFLTDCDGNVQSFPLNEWYRTPSMERLANQGVRFSSFYAHSVSSPSRASILTGQNSTRHRTTNYIEFSRNNRGPYGPLEWNWEGLTSNDVTLPKVLQSEGYRTIHIGKAHFAPQGYEGADPTVVGYDINIAGSFIGQPGSYLAEDEYGHKKGWSGSAVDGLEKYYGTDTFLTEALTLEAKDVISQAVEDGEPFYLNMAHYAVHAPFQADKRFIDNYPTSEDKPGKAPDFATLVEGMDKSLGDIMDHLEKLGIAENTLIIFLGDNGTDSPLGGPTDHASAAPLRGLKASYYEGGVRIPFIVAWGKPDAGNAFQKKFKIPQNEISLERANIMDIFPTVLEVAGAKTPADHIVDGSQLWKVIGGKADKKHNTDILLHFPHFHRGRYFSTFISGDMKIVYLYNPTDPSKPGYELYNLKTDPYEKNNLAESERATLHEMMVKLVAALEAQDAQWPVDKDQNELHPVIPAV